MVRRDIILDELVALGQHMDFEQAVRLSSIQIASKYPENAEVLVEIVSKIIDLRRL